MHKSQLLSPWSYDTIYIHIHIQLKDTTTSSFLILTLPSYVPLQVQPDRNLAKVIVLYIWGAFIITSQGENCTTESY